ncbi:nonsense-mediated mRNA decay factor SMG7-like [Andrographis paniculata]|uniref:nonsense-mediated mRNA decay factor SMG7-like n=1 Tax=Andrographis paniculata TaxID=175694 RepID=UPI0021E7A645|nr:nonsense-mediated mRNA decay factor SMG7-like [Andrographis paniculata]XP_051128282.1 nonsense-mediated mRNA decay factor SMG7-like [Andrographis paniculata]XP_051128283.1 nonsense-mediated mRNA decay factor SMG7-like [Andrographis paniculata]XP_051128285.1 nonsense-mediated mRNA decay factor SMG7-like [Andrographis paniculata]
MDQNKTFHEVVGSEKQMLASIYSKGILHDHVMELYRRIRTEYEQILLNTNSEMSQQQEVEYHLWKLHYQLIDEFRKRIGGSHRSSGVHSDNNGSLQSNIDKTLEGFRLFLSESTEFYRRLVVELRTSCRLDAEIFLTDKDPMSNSNSAESQACQHTCHRLLICLGDLSRYFESVKKSEACDWSVASKYYLEATRTWPDSGNPHNQLALLATYVGDSFLALYHCSRSLAVKEPFLDAWRNVMLLFEENRSATLPALSSQAPFDFLNPSKRSYSLDDASEKFELWLVIVRTISFFFVESSLEEFPSTLASVVNRLEAVLSVDDAKLRAILESYQNMDSSRRGPHRAIQLVSVFIFVAHSLTTSSEREESREKVGNKRSELTQLAFAAMFICLGRVTDRCLRGNVNHSDGCPLLPAVLVFVEWLVGAVDVVEAYGTDSKVKTASGYFFSALADLLDRIGRDGRGYRMDYAALWEDHELRGFDPLIRVHETMDFATHLECMNDYGSRNECRVRRLLCAATRIVEAARKCRREWIPSDAWERLLKTSEFTSEKEETTTMTTPSAKFQPIVEEEEVILFKPITRRNSAPLYISKPAKDPVSAEGVQTQTSATDEWLRRATSLSTGQNTVDDADSFSFYTSSVLSRSSPKPIDPLSTGAHPAGPPSLSAWVLTQGSSDVEPPPEKIRGGFSKQKLSPIDEMASTSFSDLAIDEAKNSTLPPHASIIIHDAPPSSPYMTPTPSAPLLPDDAAWLRGNSLAVARNEANGILGAAPIGGYISRAAVRPPVNYSPPPLSGLVDGYPPPLLGMSSSEWLYHYRNSQNMAANHLPPIHYNAPPAYHSNELSSFDLFDQWGNHLVPNPMPYLGSPQIYSSPPAPAAYGAEEPKRDKFFLGYQRPFPYVCGVGVEMNSDQPSLLQYLKEKERQVQMQPGPQLRNPTFTGNN